MECKCSSIQFLGFCNCEYYIGDIIDSVEHLADVDLTGYVLSYELTTTWHQVLASGSAIASGQLITIPFLPLNFSGVHRLRVKAVESGRTKSFLVAEINVCGEQDGICTPTVTTPSVPTNNYDLTGYTDKGNGIWCRVENGITTTLDTNRYVALVSGIVDAADINSITVPENTVALHINVDNMTSSIDVTNYTNANLLLNSEVIFRKMDTSSFKIEFNNGQVDYDFVDNRFDYISLRWDGTKLIP